MSNADYANDDTRLPGNSALRTPGMVFLPSAAAVVEAVRLSSLHNRDDPVQPGERISL